MPSFDLTDRAAIVTGGSQGLGKATALALAQAGADVVVVAREPEAVTVGRSRPHEPVGPVVEEIRGLGRRAFGVTADVRINDQVQRMVREAKEALGRIDILVNVVAEAGERRSRRGRCWSSLPRTWRRRTG